MAVDTLQYLLLDFLNWYEHPVVHAVLLCAMQISTITYYHRNLSPQRSFSHALLAFLTGFGGTLIANVMMGSPVSWLRNNLVIPMFVLCWSVQLGDDKKTISILGLCSSIVRSQVLTALESSRSTGETIIIYVDRAKSIFGEHNWVAQVVIATISGCGGGIIVTFVRYLSIGKHLGTALSPVSLSVKRAFSAALLVVMGQALIDIPSLIPVRSVTALRMGLASVVICGYLWFPIADRLKPPKRKTANATTTKDNEKEQ